MRASTIVLVLLVSSVLPTGTAKPRWWDKVKKAIRDAWEWLEEHVELNIDISVRIRRAVNGSGNDPLIKQLNSKCADFYVGADAKFSEVVEDVFNVVDEDKDGELSETEGQAFFKLIELLYYCVAVEEAKKKAPVEESAIAELEK